MYSELQKAVALIEPLLDPLHPAHEEFKRKGLEQLALVNGVNYGDLDQRRCAICQGVGHLGQGFLEVPVCCKGFFRGMAFLKV